MEPSNNISREQEYLAEQKVPVIIFLFYSIILIPFTLSPLLPLRDFLLRELVPPILFLLTFALILKNSFSPIPKGSFFSIVPLIILVYVAAIHYILNPVSATSITGGGDPGLRQYYMIFNGCCIFFCSLWFARYWSGSNRLYWHKFLNWLIITCLIFGYLRLTTYFAGIDIPFWGGRFDYDTISLQASGAKRIGGLAELSTAGITSLFALYHNKQYTTKFYIEIILFSILLLMSGGRSTVIGVVISISIFYTMIQKKYFKFIFVLIIVSIMLIGASYIQPFSTQFNRITALEGGMEKQSPNRYAFQREYWQSFLENPWIGRGIGKVISTINHKGEIITTNITHGHGSYMSILAIFGIFGGLYLLIFLFGTATKMFFFIQNYSNKKNFDYGEILLVIFCLLNMMILSVEFVAANNGFNNLRLYCLVGLATGAMCKTINELDTNYNTIEIN